MFAPRQVSDAVAILPAGVQGGVIPALFQIWMGDRWHPAPPIKPVGRFSAVRIDRTFLALAMQNAGDSHRFWMGGPTA